MRIDTYRKILPPAALLISFLISFWPVIQKLLLRWDNGDDNYCYLVIPVFFYLCWEKRGEFHFQEFTWNPWGTIPALLSSALILAGELGSVETLMYLGLWACMASIFFTLYGRRIRALIFPLIILLFIVPLPPFINRTLTFHLKMIASAISVDILRMVGVSVMLEGNIIDLGIDRLQVADACSGLRYFMPMILMGLLTAHFFTRGFWRKTIVLLLIVPLAIFINIIRIFFAGLCVVSGHAELAQNMFHDFSGWLAFMLAGIILIAVALLLKRIGRYPSPLHEIDSVPGKMKFGAGHIMTTIIICSVFFSGGLASGYFSSASLIPPRESFQDFPMKISQWEGTRFFLPDDVLQSLWADDYISASYRSPGSSSVIHLFIPYYQYQKTMHTAHAPQSCLLGSGWSLLSSRDSLIKVSGDSISIRVMSLEKDNQHLIGSYFFLQRGRVVTSPWKNKWYLLKDSITKRRTDGALVRIELLMGEGVTHEMAYDELKSFINMIWPILPQYIPN